MSHVALICTIFAFHVIYDKIHIMFLAKNFQITNSPFVTHPNLE